MKQQSTHPNPSESQDRLAVRGRQLTGSPSTLLWSSLTNQSSLLSSRFEGRGFLSVVFSSSFSCRIRVKRKFSFRMAERRTNPTALPFDRMTAVWTSHQITLRWNHFDLRPSPFANHSFPRWKWLSTHDYWPHRLSGKCCCFRSQLGRPVESIGCDCATTAQ